MPKLVQLAARLFDTPLLCQEMYARVVASVLAPRLGVQPMLQGDDYPDRKPARMPMMTDSGVLIVPVVGGLVHRGDSLDAISGTESYTHLNNVIVRALEDDETKAVLLDIDSPGGEAGGCFELADMLLDARGIKPIWGVANTDACSAAYAILASCSKAYATPSARVGSIGVCLLHVDMSQALKQAGLVTSLLYAGAHKVDGNPFEPLPKTVRADLQASLQETYTFFVEAVAKRRPMSADEVRATEARAYRAQDASDLKLVDGVLSLQGTLEALEETLGAGTSITQINQPEIETMTTPTTPAPAAPAISQEAHAAAVAQATEAGRTQGRAEAAQIMGSEHARGRETLAAAMVADASIKPASAIAMLQQAPPPQAAAPASPILQSVMNDPRNNPKPGTGGPALTEEEQRQQDRRAGLRAVGKAVR